MNPDIQSMFDSIKNSLNNDKKGNNASFRNILKLQPGNSYLVRLIPNIESPKDTFFHYSHHGWTSNETGLYVDRICSSTYGERCPICEERYKLLKKNPNLTPKEIERNKEYARQIRRLDKHLVNVFVVNDPVDEANNGTIKVLRFGVRLKEKLDAAIEGDDVDEFGSKVFDLTENGCNLKIKVETTQDGNKKFTNYNNSRFTNSSAVPGLTPEKIAEIYGSIINLSETITPASSDELKELIRVHLYSEQFKPATDSTDSTAAEPTDIPVDTNNSTSVSQSAVKKSKKSVVNDDPMTDDEKIKDLLADLDM